LQVAGEIVNVLDGIGNAEALVERALTLADEVCGKPLILRSAKDVERRMGPKRRYRRDITTFW